MNGKFLTLIQENLIEGLLTWFLLGRVLRRVVAVNQRAGILCPRSPRGTGGKGTFFFRRGGHSSGRACLFCCLWRFDNNLPSCHCKCLCDHHFIFRKHSNKHTAFVFPVLICWAYVYDEWMKTILNQQRGNDLSKMKNLLRAILNVL